MSDDREIALQHIGQIAINVQDVERATAFYRDVLGMTFLFATDGLTFFQCGSVRLMLVRAERSEFDHPASVIYYVVEHLDEMVDGLERRGVEFEAKPSLIARMADYDLWMAFFRDSEHNLLALMSEVRPPAH